MNNVLSVSNAFVSFGGVTALNNVSFGVPSGTVTALIGPNGAGKTTCFNVVSGLQGARGRIIFEGRDISKVSAHRRSGLGRTFQIVQLFGGMTVKESVMVGAHRRGVGNLVEVGITLPRVRQGEREIEDLVNSILRQLDLARFSDRLASDLPLGQQRLVELARALASDPKLLLLDESASGLSPSELANLEVVIRQLVATGISILIVEHNIRFVRKVADHLVVLNFGDVIFEGQVARGLTSPAVISAYLGKAN